MTALPRTLNGRTPSGKLIIKQDAISVKVWGDFACFTRPDLKVERVSYETLTPSAALGILERIFWKPEFQYIVTGIDVLRPVEWYSYTTKELKSCQTESVGRAILAGNRPDKERTLRSNLVLRNAAYNIHAMIRVKGDVDAHVKKYVEIFNRHIDQGACKGTPYLGLKQYMAYFDHVDPEEVPLQKTANLGSMLLKLRRVGDKQVKPLFFTAEMVNGRIKVPQQGWEGELTSVV